MKKEDPDDITPSTQTQMSVRSQVENVPVAAATEMTDTFVVTRFVYIEWTLSKHLISSGK